MRLIMAGLAVYLLSSAALLLPIDALSTNMKTGLEPSKAEPRLPNAKSKSPQFRSSVEGADFVPINELPKAKLPLPVTEYCPALIKPKTPGGLIAARRGWRILDEKRFATYDSVLFVRGFNDLTSSHCEAIEGNVAFFQGRALKALLFGKGRSPIEVHHMTIEGGNLRIWDNTPMLVGQVSRRPNALLFEKAAGEDRVCKTLRLPVVSGQRYAASRRKLMAAGWLPLKSRVEASPYPDTYTESRRARFPEVESCAGSGYAYCRFAFVSQSRNARLTVFTVGEGDDPAVTETEALCSRQ